MRRAYNSIEIQVKNVWSTYLQINRNLCDNQSVVTNSSKVEYPFNKNQSSIKYHAV